MRWQDFRRSDNVEEGSASGGGGYGFGVPVRLSGGVIVIAVVVGLLFGINPLDMLSALLGGGGGGTVAEAPAPGQAAPPASSRQGPGVITNPQREFAARVLGSTEDVWGRIFQEMGARYDPPKLHFFDGSVRSACGFTTEASGPFYCPGDRRVYLDTAFFNELETRFRAPGDFAQGYVIAHEVGHHVQNLLGIMDKYAQQQQGLDARGRNALSVRLELQADCFAGIWGHYVQGMNKLDPGDVEEGLRAASAVGDDTLQKRAQGRVVPDSFTHGSAEQRVRWFRTGFDSGDVRACNTFGSRGP
ncbi:MAG TPA: neutral zinc metallopeptidase [Casimicrobiaceae bacterium]|nr:neutral zinc metallopeptidase [Casimicrobiaceae bacterium]